MEGTQPHPAAVSAPVPAHPVHDAPVQETSVQQEEVRQSPNQQPPPVPQVPVQQSSPVQPPRPVPVQQSAPVSPVSPVQQNAAVPVPQTLVQHATTTRQQSPLGSPGLNEKATETGSRTTHITRLSPGFIVLRVFQIISALVILILCSFTAAGVYFRFNAVIGLITAIVTLVLQAWIITATYFLPVLYNYWAILAFEVFGLLIWVDAFLWLFQDTFNSSPYLYSGCYYYSGGRTCSSPTPKMQALGGSMIASAVFAGCLMIFYFVSLIIVSVFIARHRNTGGHSKIGSPAPTPVFDHAAFQREELALKRQNYEIQQHYMALQRDHENLRRQTMGYGAQAGGKPQNTTREFYAPTGQVSAPVQSYSRPRQQQYVAYTPPNAGRGVSPLPTIPQEGSREMSQMAAPPTINTQQPTDGPRTIQGPRTTTV